MAKKKVVVLVRRPPLNSVKGAEALRQAVGLTLSDNEVSVILCDAGVWLGTPLSPDVIGGEPIAKHLDTLKLLRVEVLAEAESLEMLKMPRDRLREEIRIIRGDEVYRRLVEAETVIIF